jgi:hypothetical protein
MGMSQFLACIPPGMLHTLEISPPTDFALASSSVVLIGDWRGGLAISAGYSIILGNVIAHGMVHGGTLLQNDAQVSAVAVKKSNITETLINEFSVYRQLEPDCPPHSSLFWALYLCRHRIPGHQFAQSRLLPQPYGLMPKSDQYVDIQ